MNVQALLDEANSCHDDDPRRARDLLARIDGGALDSGSWPLYGFLLNHVLGEKLGDWRAAHAAQSGLLARTSAGTTPALWRHAAVAARLAGDEGAASRCTAALAQAAGASAAQAAELVALAAAALRVSALEASAAAAVVSVALAPLTAAAWQSASGLDQPAAVQCNNLASDLLERPLAELTLPAVRNALAGAAELSQRLWQRAGTWVNHERALYLRAMAASVLGDAAGALVHAQEGLALLDAHDAANEQSVDRAFLELEASYALARLGRAGEAAAARQRADTLAAGFGDVGLEKWYADRVARNETLAA